jgi:hypothetical protein
MKAIAASIVVLAGAHLWAAAGLARVGYSEGESLGGIVLCCIGLVILVSFSGKNSNDSGK